MNFNATFFGQTIAFIVFTWFCMKFIWPWITNTLAEREKKIADGLTAAEKGQEKLEQAQKRYGELVEEGKQQAAEIISQAQKRGDELVEESKNNARSEGDRLLAAARAEIEQERVQTREQLREKVAELVVAGAQQVLMREVDRAAHKEVLDKISASL
jgi:F-type H+-transporting ATPase subunit b